MCLYPRLFKNPKYKATKKNGGVIPAISDPRVLYVPRGCGNCIECRQRKANEWRVRLHDDIQHYTNGKFVTLTFSNESYSDFANKFPKSFKGYHLDNAIAKRALRLFLERWRKKTTKSVRHWFITELGQTNTEHLHLHGILYYGEKFTNNIERERIEFNNFLNSIWKYGHTWTGWYVNHETIDYAVKYFTKCDQLHKNYKPSILATHKPAIGHNYLNSYNATLNKYKPGETKETYTNKSGHQRALPIYWRNKLYTDEEREKLWIEKLDKQERWVLGTKIDISKGEQQYLKALKQAQQINRQKGYGDDFKDWDEIAYEEERRILKQLERMNNNKKKKQTPSARSIQKGQD